MNSIREQLQGISSEKVDKEDLIRNVETFQIFVSNPSNIPSQSRNGSWWFKVAVSVAKCFAQILSNIPVIPNFFVRIFSLVVDITCKFDQCCIVEYSMITGLKKAVDTLERSLVYLEGVYSDGCRIDSGVEANFNIHTARNKILPLRNEIEGISSSQYLDDSMMDKVEWYCFVSSLLELNLQLVIELYEQSGKKSTGISNVLEKHRNDDKELLLFLYKPNAQTLKLFLKYRFEMKWPLVNTFLQSRELVVDKFTEGHLKNHVFQILNADDPSIRLSLHYCVFFFCMRAHRNTRGRKTYFKIECQEDGVHLRCPQHDRYLVSKHAWTRADKDTPGSNGVNVDWFLVKVDRQQGTGADSDCFVIVPKSTETKCLYFDFTGRVHDKAYNPSDDRCFWRLQPVDGSMVNRF